MQPYEDVAIVAQCVRSIFPAIPSCLVERVAEGVSTLVYRIQCPDTTYYLRIWPEPGASFAPELTVHCRLRAAGLRVPEVVYYEGDNATLQRSMMVTTAMSGCTIGYGPPPPAIAQILRQAGRDVARINQVAVQGYGWLDRTESPVGVLWAEYATLPLWLVQHFAPPIRALQHCRDLAPHDADRLLALLEEACHLFRHEAAVLAHGDFDLTHIFYDHATYTGVIDFGEIRGTHSLYDLGHFAIENGGLLPYLLEGYTEITPLAADAARHIQLTGLLIAARRIGRRLLQAREPHGPDVAFVMRTLPALSSHPKPFR